MKKTRKTYCIAAFNFKEDMNEIMPWTFTAKRRAIETARQMAELGAKNVRVVCDQTKIETRIK